jgi:pSer/pThr/pTyr-binding forkhead associated (FHA) protein
MATLMVWKDGILEKRVLLTNAPLTVGRGADNKLTLDDKNISRYHAEVTKGLFGYKVKDNGTINGTLVNGRKVKSHRLHNGDQIVVGDYHLHFNPIGIKRAESSIKRGNEYAVLECIQGPEKGMMFRDNALLIKIGRDRGNDIVLSKDSDVGKYHAKITFEGGRFYITDLHSASGVFLNKMRVRKRHVLDQSDMVRIGKCVFMFGHDKRDRD